MIFLGSDFLSDLLLIPGYFWCSEQIFNSEPLVLEMRMIQFHYEQLCKEKMNNYLKQERTADRK